MEKGREGSLTGLPLLFMQGVWNASVPSGLGLAPTRQGQSTRKPQLVIQCLTSQGLPTHYDSYDLRPICCGEWKLVFPGRPSPLGEALGSGLAASCSLWSLFLSP